MIEQVGEVKPDIAAQVILEGYLSQIREEKLNVKYSINLKC